MKPSSSFVYLGLPPKEFSETRGRCREFLLASLSDSRISGLETEQVQKRLLELEDSGILRHGSSSIQKLNTIDHLQIEER